MRISLLFLSDYQYSIQHLFFRVGKKVTKNLEIRLVDEERAKASLVGVVGSYQLSKYSVNLRNIRFSSLPRVKFSTFLAKKR